MNRRHLLQAAAGSVLAGPLTALLSACVRRAHEGGPEPVKLGRDACTRCQMLLSDARFVAEVRGGPRDALHKFDDIGCAVSWLAAQDWGQDPTVRIWVAARGSGAEAIEWLDARRAHYLPGYSSPMGYNFGAAATAAPDSLDFAAMRHAALNRGY